ncbi:hypothetical protein [Burkholderia ubonensis]|uniref:hypothetical protein n=1 Tax=Burkholderia ubonensis TaxID=101571 RepID=UPI0012FB9B0E|nr:hypothetical protein [Burkholderia ubonensis]
MIDLAQCLLDVSARYLGLTIERRTVTAGADADPRKVRARRRPGRRRFFVARAAVARRCDRTCRSPA